MSSQEPSGIVGRGLSDRDLQISRRLDWRFLLPEPSLGRVVYIGPGAETLVEALRAFSESLTVWPWPVDGTQTGAAAAFDLAVLRSPTESSVSLAARLLGPAGLVYCEFDRGRRFRRPGAGTDGTAFVGWAGAQRCRRALDAFGFSEVELHWHSPDFEQCQRIVPIADRLAVEHVLRTTPAPVRRFVLRGAWRAAGERLLRSTAPHMSLVARKDAPGMSS